MQSHMLIRSFFVGIMTRVGDRIMVKVYGIIADCPAMNSILNHISHNGYYCCWYCKIKGEHVINKRQYYYNENIPVRETIDFTVDSRRAQSLQANVNGRLGISMLDNILDLPLPKSIMADYLHTTLLGHGKTVCRYIYNKVMTPRERILLDKKIFIQNFLHFFNRAIRTINSTHLKLVYITIKTMFLFIALHRATEIRNILLYCILPMVRNLLDCNRIAHLGLFVAGIRVSQIKKNLEIIENTNSSTEYFSRSVN